MTTGRGDAGKTSLADGSSVPKTDERIEAIGTVDELNSFVGLLRARLPAGDDGKGDLARVQQELFDAGANLATAGATPAPDPGWVADSVAEINDTLPPLIEFVIPGGTEAAALAHVCRTVCRRAERRCWDVDGAEPVARYLNRLSDLMFVLARALNEGREGDEPQWRGMEKPQT